MAHGERPEAARIAGGEDPVAADHDQRKGAFHAAQGVGHGVGQGLLARQRNQMNQHLGVAVGLKDRALAFQLLPDRERVHQVAVVGNGNRSLVGLHHDGLGVQQGRITGRGVAGVADGENAAQRGEHFLGKDVGDQSHGAVGVEVLAVGGHDAGRLLSAMLQGVQAEIGKLLGLGVGVDGNHAAFFAEFVGRSHVVIAVRYSLLAASCWQC